MPNNKMHYIITSITLGAIAAASGLAIGLTNLLTREQININEKNKIKAGITAIFGENAEILKEEEIKGWTYTNYVYEVNQKDGEFNTKGYAFRTSGKNAYGKITLLVGFLDGVIPGSNQHALRFTSIYLVTNEQSYASTLEENYVDLVNKQEIDYEVDVNCGATYGAKLVRDMIDEAKMAVKAFYTWEIK